MLLWSGCHRVNTLRGYRVRGLAKPWCHRIESTQISDAKERHHITPTAHNPPPPVYIHQPRLGKERGLWLASGRRFLGLWLCLPKLRISVTPVLSGTSCPCSGSQSPMGLSPACLLKANPPSETKASAAGFLPGQSPSCGCTPRPLPDSLDAVPCYCLRKQSFLFLELQAGSRNGKWKVNTIWVEEVLLICFVLTEIIQQNLGQSFSNCFMNS